MGRPLPSGLAPALDDAHMRDVLAERVKALLGPAARLRRVQGTVLRRATIRYELELAGAPFTRWSLIGKIYDTPAAGEAACAAQRWLWENGFHLRPPDDVTIPRLLGFLPELRLLLMEEVGGQSLQRLLNRGSASVADLRHFAEVLVKLHRFPSPATAPFTLDQHLAERCRGLLEPVAKALPDEAGSIARIVAEAREVEAEQLPSYTLAHGDYHPGQVHVDAGRYWLLDLDLLQRRDPAYDVAMAVVRLKGMGAKRDSEGPYRELLGAFLDAYFAGMDRSIADRVPLNAALIFLKRACKRFCYQDEPGWLTAVRFQIKRAMECLEGHLRLKARRDPADVLQQCTGCPGAA